MEYAEALGMILGAFHEGGAKVKKPIECPICPRLEAMVLLEKNRANELYVLLNTANEKLEIERDAYLLLEERFLLVLGGISNTEKEKAIGIEHRPFGGIETLSNKIKRRSEESRVKRDSKKSEPVN